VVVEIGSWKGKSSVMLAAGLIRKKQPRLFCVDSFQGDEDPAYQQKYYSELMQRDPRDLEEVFKLNIRSCGLQHIAAPVRGYSFECCRGWSESIDLLFIDANHEYPAVRRDFEDWSPFVKDGGVVAFHDVSEQFEGPRRVVSEKVNPPEFGPDSFVDTLVWAIKNAAGEHCVGN
jgi:predicted O-methyltransferase YrrM